MSKKILLIIGILVIVGIAAFFILNSAPPLAPGENRVGFSIRDYLPFGNSGTETGTTTSGTSRENQTTETPIADTAGQLVPRLRKISSGPVAGAVIFNTGTTSIVRFVEKGTGNVYEANSSTVAIERLTNTTLPKIIRAFWLPNGSGFLAQTLIAESETAETSLVKLNKNPLIATSENLTPFSTTIGKLPTDIKEIAIKPDSTKIFYYTVDGLFSDWFISNPDGTGAVAVMSHPLTEWVPRWTSTNTITMQNKSSSEGVSYVYSFDVTNKILKKIGVGMVGISAITNPGGSLGLISSGGLSPKLFVVDYKTASSRQITVRGLADKCIWTKEKTPTVYCAIPNQIPGGNYPDVWFRGLVSTEDFIQKIDLNNDIYYDVSDLASESGQKIDVVDIGLSPDETHLIFRNKIDGYLWMLRIGE